MSILDLINFYRAYKAVIIIGLVVTVILPHLWITWKFTSHKNKEERRKLIGLILIEIGVFSMFLFLSSIITYIGSLPIFLQIAIATVAIAAVLYFIYRTFKRWRQFLKSSRRNNKETCEVKCHPRYPEFIAENPERTYLYKEDLIANFRRWTAQK